MTKEEIIEKVKNNMKSIGLDYDKEIGIECWDKEEIEDREYKKEKFIEFSFISQTSQCLQKMGNLMGQLKVIIVPVM